MRAIGWTATALSALLLTACGGPVASGNAPAAPAAPAPTTSTPVDHLDPGNFVTRIDNPLLPLVPGSAWVYRGRSADGGRTQILSTVLQQTREVDGVEATVVHEVVRGATGRILVDRHEWFAQDKAGNVWNLGTEPVAGRGTRRDTAGSWEAGVDGASAGIAMLARPRGGDGYRMEHLPGEAQDAAEVVATDATVTGPAGSWSGVLEVEETNPLEPEIVERRSFVRDIGLVRSETVKGGDEIVELIGFTPGT
jgi:hypothetical protein